MDLSAATREESKRCKDRRATPWKTMTPPSSPTTCADEWVRPNLLDLPHDAMVHVLTYLAAADLDFGVSLTSKAMR